MITPLAENYSKYVLKNVLLRHILVSVFHIGYTRKKYLKYAYARQLLALLT